MRQATMLVLVALGAGIGIGYLLGSSRAPAESARAERREDAVDAPERPRGSSDLAAALREFPVAARERGTGRITGVVRTPAGEPVGGATVRAWRRVGSTWRSRKGEGPPQERDLEEAVREYVRGRLRRLQNTVDAVSAADGSYLLEGLAAGRYSLRAYLEGYEASHVGRPRDVAPGETMDFVARRVHEVSVDILLPDGSRPDQAWVMCREGSNAFTENWNPAQGWIRIPPGTYTLTASVVDGDHLKSEEVSVDVAGGRTAGPVAIRLRSRPGIYGSVVIEKAQFRRVELRALAFHGNRAPSEERLVAHGQSTHASGQGYTFQDLPPGRYLLGVVLGRGAVIAKQVVDVGADRVRCDFEIKGLDPALYVAVRVLGPDGQPVTDIDIGTAYRTETSSSSSGGHWVRRADGSLLVIHNAHDFEEGGRHFVTVTSKTYGRKEVEYERGERSEVEVRFSAAATLDLTVSGLAGSEHAGALTCALKRPSEKSRFGAEGRAIGADGQVELGPVETGEWDLVLHVGTVRYERIEASRTRVTLAAGRNARTIAMPRLHSVTFVGLAPGARMSLRREGAPGWATTRKRAGKDGKAVFGPLPDGRYKAQARDGGRRMEMSVVLPGPAEVVWRGQEQNALRVVVTKVDGWFARAGFVDGDLVIGVDGSEFRSTAQTRAVFALIATKKTVTLNLLRGGRRVDLTVRSKEFMESGGKGGRFDATTR